MKEILILLFLSYASSDKLDLTYLPPPGSQYAGGRPEDIQTPLEFPKQTYSTTGRTQFTNFGQEITGPDDTVATIGINRVPPRQQNRFETPGSSPASSDSFRNTHTVPTTTVSYAFTQTTTHPPSDTFETTINPVTGFPVANNFNIPSQAPGRVIVNEQHHSGIPGTIQRVNQFAGQRPANVQGQSGLPGYEQVVDQNRYQPAISTTPGTVTALPGSPFYSTTPAGEIYVDRSQPGPDGFREGYQQTNSGVVPGFVPPTSFGQNMYPVNRTSVENYTRRPGLASSTTAEQGIVSSTPPVTSFDSYTKGPGYVSSTTSPQRLIPSNSLKNTYDGGNNQFVPSTQPGTPQTSFENQANAYNPDEINIRPNKDQSQRIFEKTGQQNQNPKGVQIPQQRYPGANVDVNGVPGLSGTDLSRPYQQYSTTSPSAVSEGLIDQQYPIDSFDGSSSRPGYSGVTKNEKPVSAVYRPERPQAESDRNAVILNYDNVITPEGFSYTFDTSNGIHADESGTSTDGIKATGSFSYTGDDGNVYSIVYTADENGYRPQGAHLPTPPPIPEAIQRIIEKVKQEEEAGIIDDGTYDEGKYGYKNYEAHKSNLPHDFGFDSDSGTEYQNNNEYNFPTRQQYGQRRPISGISTTKYNSVDQPQRQSTGKPQLIEEVRRKQPGKSPVGSEDGISIKDNGKTDIGNVEYDYQNNQPISETSSKYPTDENKYNQDNYRENNRRPVNRYQSAVDKGQYDQIDDTNIGRPAGRQEVEINGSVRRPASQQNYEYDIVPETVDDINRSMLNRPSSKQPVTKVDEYRKEATFTDNKNEIRRPLNQVSPKRPLDRVFIDEEGIATSNEYDTKYGKPSNDKKVNQLPLRTHPGTVNTPSYKLYNTEQKISKTRRPNRPGLRVNDFEQNNYYDDLQSGNYNGDINTENYDDFNTTPGYETSENDSELSQDNLSSRPPQIFSTKYAANQGKSQQPDVSRYEVNEPFDAKNQQYGQRVVTKPAFNPRTGIDENVEYQQNVNKTGYQYIPPRRKFDEVNKFPGQKSTTRVPSEQKTFYNNKGSTVTPYVTPSGSRVSYTKPEEEYYTRDNTQKPGLSASRGPYTTPEDAYYAEDDVTSNDSGFTNQQQPNRVVSIKYSKDGPSPSKAYNDAVVSTIRPSSRPVSSTYSPGYQTTRRPQPSNQYTQTSGYEITPEGDLVSNLPGSTYYTGKDFSTNGPQQYISSTTLSPSRRPSYSTTQGDRTPGQQTVSYTDGSRKPANGFVSTTPLPARPTFAGDYAPEGIKSNQFSTSYRTMDPVNPTNDYSAEISASRLPTSGPTTAPNDVTGKVKYGNRLPSTTYRPNYTIVTKETSSGRPAVVVDRYGRPIKNEPYGYQDRTPSDLTTVQNGQSKPVRYQTTTQRIIGEDFSGPKQQQKFDPKTGYYY